MKDLLGVAGFVVAAIIFIVVLGLGAHIVFGGLEDTATPEASGFELSVGVTEARVLRLERQATTAKQGKHVATEYIQAGRAFQFARMQGELKMPRSQIEATMRAALEFDKGLQSMWDDVVREGTTMTTFVGFLHMKMYDALLAWLAEKELRS